MYKIIAVLTLALITLSAAGATETVAEDASWWESVSESSRADVMFAAVDAYQRGWLGGAHWRTSTMFYAERDAIDAAHLSDQQRLRYYASLELSGKRGSNDFSKNMPSFKDKPIGAFIDGMNYFYSNNPNARAVTIGSILGCIANNPSKTCDAVAKDGF